MKMQQLSSISEIMPGLFIGNATSTYDRSTLQNNRITAVISLVNGPLNLWRQARFTDFITPDRHIWIECVDSPTQDLLVYMAGICDFIDQMLEPAQQPPKGVLVHCDQGISRSSTVVIAYMMRQQRRTREDVLADVRAKRPQVKPSANFMTQLEIWEQVGYRIWEDEAGEIPKEAYRAFRERRAADLKAEGLTGNEPLRPLNL
jgi:dual specificity phosphatase 12